jgi:hypothetical protein
MISRLALAVLLLVPAAALAEDAPPLPSEHSVLIGGDFSIALQHYWAGGSSNTLTILELAPALDVLVTPRLTVGARLAFVHTDRSGHGDEGWSAVPRIGWLAQLGPKVMIWIWFKRSGWF